MAAPHPDPKYRLHKGTGQAVVTLSGKDFYLGRYDTPGSRERYARLLAEWKASGRVLIPKEEGLTVVELVAAFWQYAESYYRKPDGTTDSELNKYKLALRPLKELYGTTPVAQFSPKRLKAVREKLVSLGWCRKSINRQITRLRSVFAWAVEEELIAASVYHALRVVKGLRLGKTVAPESPRVKPVPEPHINAIKPYVSRQVWALIQLQLLTAARAGELVRMRPIDLDMTHDVWTYCPQAHKTAHHGQNRTVYLGPKAQKVIEPFLAGRPVDAFIFSPAEAEAERNVLRRTARKTPMTPSQAKRGLYAQRRRRRRPPGAAYDVTAYRRAIARACAIADAKAHQNDSTIPADRVLFPSWHPHQLRHNAATNLRRDFGIETARIILGHKSPLVTEIYAEQDHAKAQEIIRRIG